jgi:hypothetical protein
MVTSRFARGGGAVLVALAVLVSVVPLPVAAGVSGSPNLDATLSENRVSPGETTALQISVVNTGEIDENTLGNPSLNSQVTTARGVKLTMRSGDAPIEIQSGTVGLGSVPEGSVPATFRVKVDDDADPGTYTVPVDATYEHTAFIGSQSGVYREETVDRRLEVTLRVTDDADFEIVDVETDASVGGSGQVSMTLRNDGSATAEDASVSLSSRTPDLTVGENGNAGTFVGDWEPGDTRTVRVGASVANGVGSRTLPVSASVSWREDGLPANASLSTGVRPGEESRFTVESAETTAAAGESGTLTVRMTNDGDRPVRDASVSFTTENGALTFGNAASTRTYVGDWAAGETRTVEVESVFGASAEDHPYAVDASVSYTAPDGRQVSGRSVTFGVQPAREQTFAVSDANATLRVGEDGALGGTLVNDGPATVEDAVLVLEEPGSNLNAAETEYALGDLEAGDSAGFSFDLGVSSSARSGPRQFTYRVRYEGTDGETRTSDPVHVRAEVQPERDVFAVIAENATFEAGDGGRMVVSLTNAGDQRLTDVSAKLFASDPVSTSDDEAFISAIDPGETREIVFGVGVSGGAMAKTYPVSMDFQYTEPDGDTKLSNTYRLPVTVQESEGGFLSLGLGLGVLGLVLVAGLAVRFR